MALMIKSRHSSLIYKSFSFVCFELQILSFSRENFAWGFKLRSGLIYRVQWSIFLCFKFSFCSTSRFIKISWCFYNLNQAKISCKVFTQLYFDTFSPKNRNENFTSYTIKTNSFHLRPSQNKAKPRNPLKPTQKSPLFHRQLFHKHFPPTFSFQFNAIKFDQKWLHSHTKVGFSKSSSVGFISK